MTKKDVDDFLDNAKKGHPQAQFLLGELYFHGDEIEQNYSEAFYWYTKSAEQNFSYAQNNLGVMYEYGYFVNQDYQQAFSWYKKAAEQGLALSQYNLGVFYANGYGVKQDYTEALKWYKKAAAQNFAEAQRDIGSFYEYGNGVEQNYKEAMNWYKKASEQGEPGAQNNIGLLYDNGWGVVKNHSEAIDWYKKAAIQGEPIAQFNLAHCYQEECDFINAILWYEKSARQGYDGAQYNLGRMYYYGIGVKIDYEKAKRLFEEASANGHCNATTLLADIYHNGGYGVSKDYKKAFELYQQAGKQGNEWALFNLGFMFFCGEGISKDDFKAFKFMEQAADKDAATAKLLLSCMYKNGDGVEKSEAKAKELWNQVKNELDNDIISSLIEKYYKYRNSLSIEEEMNPNAKENAEISQLYHIKSVEVVSGKLLCPYWKTKMQLVSTDKGIYIDNLPGISHGSTPPGHDWKKEIGQTVDVVTSKDQKTDNTWIFIRQEYEKYNNFSIVSYKEELPQDYDINENPELVKAYKAIKENVPVIFLTGGAGTGKSTFIKFLKNNLKTDMNKNYVVLAPTGVAAINVGGQTIHSFFRWNNDVFNDEEVTKGLYTNPVIDHTDLIIIDEISMVPSWMLDHIDYALRLWCDKNKPFGGKQLLLIGDCFQLPPVVEDQDLEKKKYYSQWESPFFFAADSLKKLSNIKAFQLKKIYRQENDQRFMHILNRIRECKDGYEKDVAYLNENCLIETRLGTKNVPPECLLLCTTNAKADEFNNKKLFNLVNKGKQSITYKAFIEGDFHYDNKRFLTKDSLDICIGAKIMVTKNLNSEHLVNGDMGIVLDFGGTGNSQNDYVDIEVKETKHHITRQTWEKQKYEWNSATKTISQKVVGTFNQIPLTLGWAVTIHKSQGLTLDSVAIDAPDAWDSGQIYVALSRAKNLDGVLLCQKIPFSAVKVSEYVKQKYGELFQSDENGNITPLENDYNTDLSNEEFTIDKSEELTSVKIGGIEFELYPKGTEKIGHFAQKTISTLLVHNLIPEQEMLRLLKDKDYSYFTFGICYSFKTWVLKVPLLTKDRINNENRVRYWATAYNGYYICSQWYPDCKPKLAKWLINLSKGKLSEYTIAEDDSYNDESVDWAKIKQEEKEKNFAALFKQQKEMNEKLKNYQQSGNFGNILRKNTNKNIDNSFENHFKKEKIIESKQVNISNATDAKQSEKDKTKTVIETIIASRRPSTFNGKCQFILTTKDFILADEEGMENTSLPWSNRNVALIVYNRENDIITDWKWEYI